MSPNIPPHRLLTAEEYARLPDDGRQTELVRGVVVEVSGPSDIRPEVENSAREVVFVLRGSNESWARTLAAVAKHLSAGLRAVCVLRPSDKSITVYRDEREPEYFNADTQLTLPDVLPGFRVPVRQFFE